MLPASNRVGDLVRDLLDRGYERAARESLTAIVRSTNDGAIAQRLAELEREAARLAREGGRLTPDNAVLRALRADLDPVMDANRRRLDEAARRAAESGTGSAGRLTRELAIPGFSDDGLAQIGVRWNTPDPEAVNSLVNYVNSDGWRAELEDYKPRLQRVINNQLVQGIVEGWNPRKTAAAIRSMVEGFPAAQAETLARTIQLTSYRDATVLHQVANADILSGIIRIAALDARTCMACVALHGTRLEIGQRIDDHHNGRCTSISEVRGRPRTVQSGEAWFRGLDDERQRAQMGDGAWVAWQQGRLQLRDLVQRYDDRVFRSMVREGSLSGALGADAQRFIREGRTLPRIDREAILRQSNRQRQRVTAAPGAPTPVRTRLINIGGDTPPAEDIPIPPRGTT